MIDPHRPLTQNEVRGLFTRSPGHGATIRFSKEFPNVVCVLNRNGHAFDLNFHVGLQRLVQICDEQGVTLDPHAAADVAPLELTDAREAEEALDLQEHAFEGTGAVETDITPDTVDARQEVARAAKPKKKGASG
jgi:hypothetical protein